MGRPTDRHRRHALLLAGVVALGGGLPVITAAAQAPAQAGPAAVQAPAPVEAAPVLWMGPEAPAELPPTPEAEAPEPTGEVIGSGEASFYGKGDGFAGRQTANGEVFDPSELTAAHKTLPFGTRLVVTNEANGESVVVRVNDRGPYAHGRVVDLSYAAAEAIGMVASGTADVTLARLD